MSNRDTIQDELRSLESSLPVLESPIFSVPENYFEGLAAVVLVKVKSGQTSEVQDELNDVAPLLAGINKTTPYSVPPSYFDENLQNILLPEIETKPAVLETIGKELPYQAPAGYFDRFSAQMLAKVNAPTAKVVPLFARTWMRTAVAAVIAAGLVFGGMQIFNGKQQPDDLAAGKAQTTSAPIAENKPVIAQEIKKVSTKDLEAFVGNVPVAAASAAPKKESSSKKEATELLKDVSENEMENFLAAIPQADDELSATDQP